MQSNKKHFINNRPLLGPFPNHTEKAVFGMGCFWGVERLFWNIPGVYLTAVGYADGHKNETTYEEVCTGKTGHAEIVLIIFDPNKLEYEFLLKVFWENHDPTQINRQGNDVGTQYRSIIMTNSKIQLKKAQDSKVRYQEHLTKRGFDAIATQIIPFKHMCYAEDYHQQYLAKNPNGYCGLKGTGIKC